MCSVNIDRIARRSSYQRHFLVPFAWLSTSTKFMENITEYGDFVFILGNEVAVIKHSLDNVSTVSLRHA